MNLNMIFFSSSNSIQFGLSIIYPCNNIPKTDTFKACIEQHLKKTFFSHSVVLKERKSYASIQS